jgi:hypothetical protein
MSSHPNKKPSGWTAKLTRQIKLKDGTVLVTLADARVAVIRYFETVIESASVARAIERLKKAAATGTRQDRKSATDQVAIVLRGRAVY